MYMGLGVQETGKEKNYLFHEFIDLDSGMTLGGSNLRGTDTVSTTQTFLMWFLQGFSIQTSFRQLRIFTCST